eukprot:CAMPEP_0183353704 /NCGR_PEP_ID=MMETSP0164_2-20130417/34598_1 /TAXON_ID=221442 /ORGANISM="Coccolithus pelagicus ssp braarudi, Strain PLY182g" /LENGTH=94 /DNA_ID=CAMNT_0025526431 /DNA_START=191 /DNA_END=476 /DNA_ORIENTATION=+
MGQEHLSLTDVGRRGHQQPPFFKPPRSTPLYYWEDLSRLDPGGTNNGDEAGMPRCSRMAGYDAEEQGEGADNEQRESPARRGLRKAEQLEDAEG